MTRLNLRLLMLLVAVSLVCYRQADSQQRSRYGRMLSTFVTVLDQVENRFIEPTDDRVLFEAALKGLVNELDDPFSAYYNPHRASLSRSSLQQTFGGIGVEVQYDRQSRQLTIMAALPGTPAYDAGLLAGDRLTRINDEVVDDFGIDDVTKRLRGKPGTTVRVTVARSGVDEPLDFTLRRATIKTETVLGDRRRVGSGWEFTLAEHPRIAYVRLTLFGRKTIDELQTVLEQRQAAGQLDGLILDLRNNHGGLLDAAEACCDLFVNDGVVVSIRGRDGQERRVRRASGNAPFSKLPVVVLINQQSASASEVVAACLQDHDRATIVGVRSFGKGTVQDVVPLENGRSELRLTVATYWRPSGQNIHRHRADTDQDAWGVRPTPGYEVPLTDTEFARVWKARRLRDAPLPAAGGAAAPDAEPVDDPQLARAIQALDERRAK